MTDPFLKLTANYIYSNYKDTAENLCIVLPNKRGALFLKKHLIEVFSKTMWLPNIISAEDLIAELSGLKILEEIDLMCYLYDSYKIVYGQKAESFDGFAKWGQLILQDFNEIDRYLANSEQLYENLKNIKEIENWSLGEEVLSEYQLNYLEFMNSLGAIYKHFSSFLIQNKWAYQGLAYKQAVANIKSNNFEDKFHKLIFCGFNALNAAELKLFYRFYEKNKADILWDVDKYYLDNPNQEAGLFLRANFKLFKQRDPLFIQENFKTKKEIQIVSVPKQIGQAQVVKQVLQKYIDNNIPLDKVAVVLANEKLLWPVLQQLPPAIEYINITMGYPLKYTSTYGLIDILLQIQLNYAKQTRKQKTLYHKDLLALLRQPLFQNYLTGEGLVIDPILIIYQITQRNLNFISEPVLEQLFNQNYSLLSPLLLPMKSTIDFCNLLQSLLETLINYFTNQQTTNQSNLELEYLQVILKNLNRLSGILTKYQHFNNIQSFKQLYNQVVGNSSAPFIGEPLQGLQIMGVLETRNLDFDYVILVNVNEGVLPSGKSVNSFIPNDLKRVFGLPLYAEKDAIYAYHFYRLLQKANDVTIIYDSESDSFGKGEKSRFVTQLQLEMIEYNSEIKITESVASYKNLPTELINSIVINKNTETLNSIIKKATSNDMYFGLSPSSLTSFKECSLRFYFRYGLGLKESKEVEEIAEASTFGLILHKSLEILYSPFINQIIQIKNLEEALLKIDLTVNESFVSFFDGNEPIGKSLLQKEVIKVYVKKLLKNDIKFITKLVKENQLITILKLEEEFSAPLNIQINGKDATVFIKGKIDRIDTYNNMIRVIDYKSSVKDSDQFVFSNFENLFNDKIYNKQFQLFLYSWLLYKNNFCQPSQLMMGIIPFKIFTDDPKYILDSEKKPFVFSDKFLLDFENELKLFIMQIINYSSSFEQTNDITSCTYCSYNTICNVKTDKNIF